MLSQLSYSPHFNLQLTSLEADKPDSQELLVGLGRFELPTSPLSGVRSNQLSYRPGIARTLPSSFHLIGLLPARLALY